MEDFDWTHFSKQIFIKTDIASVYNTWTKSEELEKWFLSKARFRSQDEKKILLSENSTSHSIYNWNWFAQNHYKGGAVREANGIDYLEFTFAGTCIVKFIYPK